MPPTSPLFGGSLRRGVRDGRGTVGGAALIITVCARSPSLSQRSDGGSTRTVAAPTGSVAPRDAFTGGFFESLMDASDPNMTHVKLTPSTQSGPELDSGAD